MFFPFWEIQQLTKRDHHRSGDTHFSTMKWFGHHLCQFVQIEKNERNELISGPFFSWEKKERDRWDPCSSKSNADQIHTIKMGLDMWWAMNLFWRPCADIETIFKVSVKPHKSNTFDTGISRIKRYLCCVSNWIKATLLFQIICIQADVF